MHPKYGKAVEYCFTVDGVNYYKLTHPHEMYQDRAAFLMQFSEEGDRKLTGDDLNAFMDAIIEQTKIPQDGKIDLGAIQELAKEVKYRQEWLFEPDSLYRFASVMYFDLKENIKTYDWEYNKDKIGAWKKKETALRYILREHFRGHNPFLNLSDSDFRGYMQKLKENLERQKTLISGLKASKSKKEKGRKTSGSGKR